MTRVVKKPDIRRLEILKAAETLFDTHGYENTSVEAIIKAVGIAKGTFYHYFRAKKDILKAIVEQVGFKMEEHFKTIAMMNHLTTIQKLKLMIGGPDKKKLTDTAVMELIHKPENRELQEQLNIQAVEKIAPILTDVLNQGTHEGLFHSNISIESVQLILAGSQFLLSSGLFNLSKDGRVALLKAVQNTLELVVHAKPGTLSFISEE